MRISAVRSRKALHAKAEELFATPPQIERLDILAIKIVSA